MLESFFGAPPTDIEVLVVGAGPVGLSAALLFSLAGVDTRVVEERFALQAQGEELLLEPAALAVLEEVGVLPELLSAGEPLDGVVVYDRGSPSKRTPFAKGEQGPAAALVVARERLKQLLLDELVARDVPIHFAHRLHTLDAGEDGCRVGIDQLDHVGAGISLEAAEAVVVKSHDIRAGLVIGADGPASTVRRALGIAFAPIGNVRCELVTELEGPAEFEPQVRVNVTETGADVLWPLGGRRYRLVRRLDLAEATRKLRIEPHERDEFARLPVPEAYLRTLLDRAPARIDLDLQRPIGAHALVYQPRCAVRVAGQSVVLAGAAAHLLHPSLGTGDNLGILEVRELVRHALAVTNDQDGTHVRPHGAAYTRACGILLDRAASGVSPLPSPIASSGSVA